MKIIDATAIIILVVGFLLMGYGWMTWKGSVAQDSSGQYDLRKNKPEPVLFEQKVKKTEE